MAKVKAKAKVKRSKAKVKRAPKLNVSKNLMVMKDKPVYTKGSNVSQSKMSRRQYKLEKERLKTQRFEIDQKPETIRAYGAAFRDATATPLSSYAVGKGVGVASQGSTAAAVQNLTSGGAQITNKNNEEEEDQASSFYPD